MIVQDVVLACSPARAFRLVTEHAGAWWPADRRHTRDPASTITMQADGPFRERAHDGLEVELGRVRTWEEGRRVVLDFYPGTGPLAPTEVEITFAAEGDSTRVTVVHRPGRAGDLWAQRAPTFARSWAAVLAALAHATAATSLGVGDP